MKLTVKKLRNKARRKKIPGFSTMSKAQLMEALGLPKADTGRVGVTHQEPPVVHQEPPIKVPGIYAEGMTPSAEEQRRNSPKFYWPKEKDMPEKYRKRQRMPCPRCRRVSLDNTSQAVVCTGLTKELAYFRCKACGYRWKLPLE